MSIMAEPLAFWNRRLVAASEVTISLDDAGFVWGATVTDRVRTYNGRLFRLADHVARFRRSCEMCRIPQSVADAEIASIAGRLVEHNRTQQSAVAELVLVMFATPGSGRGDATLCLHTVPFSPEPYRILLQNGATLITPTVRHVPPECLPRGAKMRSRLFWWMAEQEVRAVDLNAQALLLDQNGYVTETCIANFAIVQRGSILTPPRSTVLDGVSLRVVEELCGELGIPFEESLLRLEDCYTADEAILTSTPFGVAGVSSIDGRPIPFPGSVLSRLCERWSRMVGCPIWQ
jgi:branched-chain amino acid aminotransferase